MSVTRHQQQDKYSSPWSLATRVRTLLWELCWAVFCYWTPKPMNAWRLLFLRAFGTTIHGKPFVHQRAKITHPWRLTLHDRACLGDGAVAYTLGEIVLEAGCTIAQEAYLCTGTHDFADPVMPLVTAPIRICPNVFIGLRAIVMPGVTIGSSAIVGAGSLVTSDVADSDVVVGLPARRIRNRIPEGLNLV